MRWFSVYRLARPVFGKKEEVVVCSAWPKLNECHEQAERDGYLSPFMARIVGKT